MKLDITTYMDNFLDKELVKNIVVEKKRFFKN